MNTTVNKVKNGAEDVVDDVANVADVARGGLLDAANKVVQVVRLVRSVGIDDVLATAGLARKRNMLQAAMPFAGGFALGMGAGLMFAPSSGHALRSNIRHSIRSILARRSETAPKTELSVIEPAVSPVAHTEGAPNTTKNHDASRP